MNRFDKYEATRSLARDAIAGAVMDRTHMPLDDALAVADVVLLRLRRLGFEIVPAEAVA